MPLWWPILLRHAPNPARCRHGLLTNNAYNADGSIRDWRNFAGNGVVGRKAFVKVSAYSDDEGNSHSFTFVLNRQVIGTIALPPAPNSQSLHVTKCIEVDIDRVRFALRNTGATPTPGQNQITVFGDGRLPPITCEICVVGASVESISIEAMAPVMLVHGIHSGPGAFDQFEPVLTEMGMPTRTVNLGDGTIADGGATLAQEVLNTANEFGVSRVHVIGHSKGGLWARSMMRRLPPDLGVYSLTTVDTPHNGSALADLGSQTVAPLTPLFALARSISDLSVSSARGFNNSNPLVTLYPGTDRSNSVKYSFFAADANINSDTEPGGRGVIDDDESTYDFAGGGSYSFNPMLYRFLEGTREVRWTYGPDGPIPDVIPVEGAWKKNDFVVTEESSWCTGTTVCAVAEASGHLVWIPAPFVHWKGTHGSVLYADAARFIARTLGIALEADLEN